MILVNCMQNVIASGSFCPLQSVSFCLINADRLCNCTVFFSVLKSQVMHHWDSVHRPLIGDFLHCGGQQLLLLFDGSLPKPLPAAYLLTDLQGFVFDRREGDGEKLSQNKTQEEDKPGNLQRVTAALWQQNQVHKNKKNT